MFKDYDHNGCTDLSITAINDWVFQPDVSLPENINIRVTTAPKSLSVHQNLSPELQEGNQNNRQALVELFGINEIQWLHQVHKADVVTVDQPIYPYPTADGVMTTRPQLACAVLTADCVPVILFDDQGYQVAAIHCGWRSLALGILDRAIQNFQTAPHAIHAYIGPCIGPGVYQIDEAVKNQFTQYDSNDIFKPDPQSKNHWFFNLVKLTELMLKNSGLQSQNILSENICTATDQRFFSYRASKTQGRFATLIWKTQ